MSSTTIRVRPVVESRPVGQLWGSTGEPAASSEQPPLDLAVEADLDRPPASVSLDSVRVSLVAGGWCVAQRRGLPDSRTWSVTLAVALVETLYAFRPVAQLGRWLDDDVLAAVGIHQRRRQLANRARGVRARPPVVRAVRIQHPEPNVAEVAVQLQAGARFGALAFRLVASGERWLCTALEVGGRPGTG